MGVNIAKMKQSPLIENLRFSNLQGTKICG
jgi:hypothetical protein